ncbi:coatomer WD associated region-domain-containing protein [Boletus reticuloceps]|uniref:Coatomer WD associated region-domain-containing protein n=1 Tax=Boletus reticuloceps TaxID=495285 RepID=A0A8I2YFT4_9AGAM|nr:coatomer WD associated region-domain-containing protein [Boletus reticuloceps]
MKGSGSWSIDGLHGGSLLGARGQGFVVFWDWESGEIVGRIDVYWSGTGSLGVAITSEDSSYILRFNRDVHNAKLEEGVEVMDEGVEEAFDIVSEPSNNTRSIMTAKSVGGCFIYTTVGNRVNYFVGNESYTISLSDMYVLLEQVSSLADFFQTYVHPWLHTSTQPGMPCRGDECLLLCLVLKNDMGAAAKILLTLPKEQLNKVARFLEGRVGLSPRSRDGCLLARHDVKDLKELAMQVTNDPDIRSVIAAG